MAAKGKSDGGERSNRFRFVMLDADLSDANVNALAHAIVSALKPEAAPVVKRLPGVVTTVANRLPAPAVTPVDGSNGAHDNSEIETEPAAAPESATDNEEAAAVPTSTAQRTRKPSKPTQPKFFDDLFPTPADADSFTAFVAQHPTTKDSERYLVAAVYLRDNGHAVVDLNKIYTCYRMIDDWEMTINDWDVNLRNQLRNDRFRRVDGGYTVTTRGEAIVQGLRTK
jgi:hypothetical protein